MKFCSCFDVYILLFLSFCVYITQRNPNKNKNVIFYTQKRFHSLQLRNGQSVCTDNECTDLVSPQTGGPGANPADSFTWMMFMMIAAVILYLIRPNSLRRRENDGSNKSSRDDVSDSFLQRKMCLNFSFSDHRMIHNRRWQIDVQPTLKQACKPLEKLLKSLKTNVFIKTH